MASWTVMVYMNADHEGFDEAAKTNLEQMAAVGSDENLNIVVLLDRALPGRVRNIEPYLPRICKVEKGMTYPPKAQRVLDGDFENMGSPRTLKTFIEHCQEKHPAEKYMLVIWDHGGGTHAVGGRGEEAEAMTQVLQMAEAVQTAPGRTQIRRWMRRLMRRQFSPNSFLHYPNSHSRREGTPTPTDPDHDSVLFVTEIRDCLKDCFRGDKKLEVLVFDACWMQTVENAWTLRQNVEYVVAAEGTMSISGIGYQPALLALRTNPACTAGDASRYLVEGTTLSQNHFKRLTISGLDLSFMERMGQLFQQFGQRCPEDNTLFFEAFRFARFLCLPFYLSENQNFINVQVIDLIYFLEKFCEVLETTAEEVESNRKAGERSDGEKEFLTASKNVLETVQQMIFLGHMSLIRHKSIGSHMSVHESEQALKTWGAHGLAFFLPEHASQWDEYRNAGEWYFLEGEEQLPFVKDNGEWIKFLHRYFDWLREQPLGLF